MTLREFREVFEAENFGLCLVDGTDHKEEIWFSTLYNAYRCGDETLTDNEVDDLRVKAVNGGGRYSMGYIELIRE